MILKSQIDFLHLDYHNLIPIFFLNIIICYMNKEKSPRRLFLSMFPLPPQTQKAVRRSAHNP